MSIEGEFPTEIGLGEVEPALSGFGEAAVDEGRAIEEYESGLVQGAEQFGEGELGAAADVGEGVVHGAEALGSGI
ncbi:MAG TPA: hypothetical protein VME70_08525, partial [Mycobacteriales bacterium]|nr:hypothetical protein [Mycobacteriales bacterium]